MCRLLGTWCVLEREVFLDDTNANCIWTHYADCPDGILAYRIVIEGIRDGKLTALMITHNMKDAIAHGNRLIMMDAGRVVVDISGEEKKKLTVPDLLALFSSASGSTEANDKLLLS